MIFYNKFKKLFIILVFIPLVYFFSINILQAQRPNTKKVQLKYLIPPETPLPENIKLYTSRVINLTSVYLPIPFPSQNKVIKLIGYKTAPSISEADLTIKFVVNSISLNGAPIESKYREKINDSVSIERIGGIYNIEAFLNYSKYVEDVKNNKVLISKEGISIRNSFKSYRYKTYGEAIKAFEKNKENHAAKLNYSLYNSALGDFKYEINNSYGFPLKQSRYSIARGKGRKYDYSDLQSAFNIFQNTLEEYNGHDISQEFEKNILKCIEIWNIAIQQYIPKKRRTRIGDKIIGELYYNVAVAYFVLRDWNKVYENLEKIKKNKRLKKISNNFELQTKNMQNRYNKQNALN